MNTRIMGHQPATTLAQAVVRLVLGRFLVTRDGRLLNPALDEAVLLGITRARVQEKAARLDIAAHETRIEHAALGETATVFLIGSLRGLRAVATIEGAYTGLKVDHAAVQRLGDSISLAPGRPMGEPSILGHGRQEWLHRHIRPRQPTARACPARRCARSFG